MAAPENRERGGPVRGGACFTPADRLAAASDVAVTLTPAREVRSARAASALGTQSLSRANLAARTSLNDTAVRRWLSIMRTEGTIELIGDSPRRTRRSLNRKPR